MGLVANLLVSETSEQFTRFVVKIRFLERRIHDNQRQTICPSGESFR
jgi:hypothetical protein